MATDAFFTPYPGITKMIAFLKKRNERYLLISTNHVSFGNHVPTNALEWLENLPQEVARGGIMPEEMPVIEAACHAAFAHWRKLVEETRSALD